ncbi:MAG: signal peptide peptidase SppA [Sphingobacteriales bacterium]|nr:MAG: signal peptide peptidase SppA [Sphingobacteriales bacterium]
MKQFFKMFFASLFAMIVAGVIVFGVLIGVAITAVTKSMSNDKETKVSNNSVLLIDMGKVLHEQGEKNSLALFAEESPFSAGLYNVVKALEKAKEDKDIKGILIKMEASPNGWATSQQLRMALKDFKKSGKFIYAYGEAISQGSYYVASVADSVFLNPMGDMELKGFAAIMPFFKGTLDKLELQPEIFYAGKFKSATEPFRAEKMSEPNRLQTSEFMQDFWEEFLTAAAEHTKSDTASVHQLAVTGAIQFPEDALRHKLVDGLVYWDQVEARLRSKTDRKEKEEIKYVALDDYANKVKTEGKGDDRVAVIFAEGSIVDGKNNADYQIASEDMAKTIRKIRNNEKVKAVVLRVNSPGGSALASEVILRELQLLKQKKPLVVSMGDVAASGGYYIACQADSIFALPNTITGSIGVFTMLFNSENLMKNKLGITFDGVKNTPYADFPSATRAMTPDEAQKMQRSVDHIYTVFKERVAKGRRMDTAMVDSFAQGRVWSGRDALRIGLVDGLGGLDRALESAAKLAKLKDYKIATYPEPVDKFESMMRRFGGASVDASALKLAIEQQLGEDYQYYLQVKQLKDMNGRAMMMMPFNITVR